MRSTTARMAATTAGRSTRFCPVSDGTSAPAGSGSKAKFCTVASLPRADTTAPDTESGASSTAASGGGLASQEVRILIVHRSIGLLLDERDFVDFP